VFFDFFFSFFFFVDRGNVDGGFGFMWISPGQFPGSKLVMLQNAVWERGVVASGVVGRNLSNIDLSVHGCSMVAPCRDPN